MDLFKCFFIKEQSPKQHERSQKLLIGMYIQRIILSFSIMDFCHSIVLPLSVIIGIPIIIMVSSDCLFKGQDIY